MLTRFDRLVRKCPARARGREARGSRRQRGRASSPEGRLTPGSCRLLPAGPAAPAFRRGNNEPGCAHGPLCGLLRPGRARGVAPPAGSGCPGAPTAPEEVRPGEAAAPSSRPGPRTGEPGQAPLLREPAAGPAPFPQKRPEGPAQDGTALISRLQRRPGAWPARGGRAPLAPRREGHARPRPNGSLRLTPTRPLLNHRPPKSQAPAPRHEVSRGAAKVPL